MADTANELQGDEGRAKSGDPLVFSQTESFLSRQTSSVLLASASFDSPGRNRAFGDRTANTNSSLPDVTITNELISLDRPLPILPRDADKTNFLSPAYQAPTLQELSNRRQFASMGDATSLDKLSRGALDYVKNNSEQLRKTVARGPFEATAAARYLPNVTIGPSLSSYSYDMPRNWQQQNNGFQGCPCPNCTNVNYRPENGPRPYQTQPWSAPQQFNQSQQFNPAQQFNQVQQFDQRYDALMPRPGEFRPASSRVTPDLMPPGWFEELYGNPNQAQPRQQYNDVPQSPRDYPGRRPPNNRPPEAFDPQNLPPPRPDLVRPGENDIRMISEPSISAEKIDEILRYYKSPAVGVGKELYALGVKYGIDPAIALGFFIVESTAGKHGRAARNLSWGNIKGTGPAGSDGTFRKYNSFAEGAEDWFKLLKYQYIATEPNEFYRRKPFGAQTLRAVINKYAPGSDGNNEGGYVRTVINLRQKWAREMLAQQPSNQRTAESDR